MDLKMQGVVTLATESSLVKTGWNTPLLGKEMYHVSDDQVSGDVSTHPYCWFSTGDKLFKYKGWGTGQTVNVYSFSKQAQELWVNVFTPKSYVCTILRLQKKTVKELMASRTTILSVVVWERGFWGPSKTKRSGMLDKSATTHITAWLEQFKWQVFNRFPYRLEKHKRLILIIFTRESKLNAGVSLIPSLHNTCKHNQRTFWMNMSTPMWVPAWMIKFFLLCWVHWTRATSTLMKWWCCKRTNLNYVTVHHYIISKYTSI